MGRDEISDAPKARKAPERGLTAEGRCLCGQVRLQIDVPAFWAWHDHSAASRRAQGCAYATYVGCWKSRCRVIEGSERITRFEEAGTGAVRSFCSACGTPLLYERRRAPKMVNIPRALFATRTGREPLYHLAIEERADWIYQGEPLVPLKGYPGVVWTRPRRRQKQDLEGIF